MPDITMCASDTCNVRHNCKRNTASGTVASEYQSIFLPEETGDTCDYYWPNRSKEDS
jgi:hypothetical protein